MVHIGYRGFSLCGMQDTDVISEEGYVLLADKTEVCAACQDILTKEENPSPEQSEDRPADEDTEE